MAQDPSRYVLIDREHRNVYRPQIRVAQAVSEAAASAGFDRRFIELINIRVSQINGCAVCLDTHVRDALAAGETHQRLGVLRAWRDTSLFTDVERAALAVAELVTELPGYERRDEVLAQARQHLSDEQLSVVSWLAINMNAFNRISIISGHQVNARPDDGAAQTSREES